MFFFFKWLDNCLLNVIIIIYFLLLKCIFNKIYYALIKNGVCTRVYKMKLYDISILRKKKILLLVITFY
jgi:hypothetical protein